MYRRANAVTACIGTPACTNPEGAGPGVSGGRPARSGASTARPRTTSGRVTTPRATTATRRRPGTTRRGGGAAGGEATRAGLPAAVGARAGLSGSRRPVRTGQSRGVGSLVAGRGTRRRRPWPGASGASHMPRVPTPDRPVEGGGAVGAFRTWLLTAEAAGVGGSHTRLMAKPEEGSGTNTGRVSDLANDVKDLVTDEDGRGRPSSSPYPPRGRPIVR